MPFPLLASGAGRVLLFALIAGALLAAANSSTAEEIARVHGERMVWHRVTLDVVGPEASESGELNPFTDVLLEVTFTLGDHTIRVPGFFAADGDAAETGATSGKTWRVHFAPPQAGTWKYEIRFVQGKDVVLGKAIDSAVKLRLDGARGELKIADTDKSLPDFRQAGALRYVGERYLQFAGTKTWYLKTGADSPENFLAYADFDGTPAKHRYQPHVKDWQKVDPTWQGEKGKGILGAVNYLADQGVNSIYFLTMNVQGDGKDVWPWTSDKERRRFDCSKLDQWEILFSHMQAKGVAMHVITQETENDQLLDGGKLGDERKLYYRELIARFAHHPAVVWNLGEENTNTTAQQKAFCNYIRELDPYDHPIVVHTFPGKYENVYKPLLGFEALEGPSLQTNDTHSQTIRWIDASAEAGRKWVVCLDEIGPANTGVKPDADDPQHDDVRRLHLWGNLLAGGAGVEWYFGYKFAHNDLNLEDFRSREAMWQQSRIAREILEKQLPFTQMTHHDDLLRGKKGYLFAQPGNCYAVYTWGKGECEVELAKGSYHLTWWNPRDGSSVEAAEITAEEAGFQKLPSPPQDPEEDWLAILKAKPASSK